MSEQRREERVPAALGVTLGSGRGVTRDVSASGAYLEIDGSFTAGSPIELTIDLDLPAGPMQLCCRGSVVRVEDRQGRKGVAVKFAESVLKVAKATETVDLTPIYQSSIGKQIGVK